MPNYFFNKSVETFSRSQGLSETPKKLQIGQLPLPLRNHLWSVIYHHLKRALDSNRYRIELHVSGSWEEILYDFETNVMFLPADEFYSGWDHVKNKYKSLILQAPFNHVLDFIQYLLRHENRPHQFKIEIEHLFKEHLAAYTLIEDGRTIAPSATTEEGQALANSMAQVRNAGFMGAHQHLIKAIERFNSAQFADSIRESIHAVDSVARRIDPKSSSTLAPALRNLKQKIYLNNQFLSGVEKIYAYTNSEEGLRHPLIDDEKAQVDDSDALFMIGACASFCSYLVAKGRKAGLIDDT